MRILALEPYYGGSHKAFLDGWSSRSRHQWTVLDLPAYKWKWRMRHAAITFAQKVTQRIDSGQAWDLIFCSDMLNLAEFLGLVGPDIATLPSIAYFHENQLTYPVRHQSQRDYQFAMTNLTTALAATSVWFNSAFHRDSFLSAATDFLKQMPDYHQLELIERIRTKTCIQYPGIDDFPARKARHPGPIRILWAARWEHDKNPETFFQALKQLRLSNVDFRVSVIGQQFRDSPEVFHWARKYFDDQIDRWGYQPTGDQYRRALFEADVVVSTANHEFFGITIVEAIAAGAYPLVPHRLAYPEILCSKPTASMDDFFYPGSDEQLAEKLALLARQAQRDQLWQDNLSPAIRSVAMFSWKHQVPQLDQALENVQKQNRTNYRLPSEPIL